MKDDTPWYEKANTWLGIVASIFAILGVTVFGNIVLVKDKNEEDKNTAATYSSENTTIDSNEQQQNNEKNDQPSTVTSEKEDENNNIELGTPFVESTPKQDTVINAHLTTWDKEKDRDIIGNTYSSAMKLSVYNFIYALGGGSDDIVANVHIPLGEKLTGTWIISFVVAQDMVGNGSSANITIMSGDKELYPSFTIDSTTTEELIYEVQLDGIRDLVISCDCNAVDNGFCIGIVLEDK